jgi:Holliday junction resolvase
MLPVTGELLDFSALVTGYNVAGRRALTGNERLLCAVGVLLPLLSGKSLGAGGEVVEKVALATGRSADEVHAMVRVARQVAPEDAARLERISRTAVRTGRLAEEDWNFLQRTARHLDSVLAEFHEALKRGERVPFLALRTGSDGLRLVPGSAEHMAQAWMEYQFRHPRKYPHFRYAPDEGWRRMYRAILENKAQGSSFEREVLQKLGHEKNTALLMPPPGSKAQGFIPDAVPGNPNPGELVWGQPYRFVESKAHKDLALTGNLKAMIEYVEQYGGHIELWVRSPRHADGPTRLTNSLQKRLSDLSAAGRAAVRRNP